MEWEYFLANSISPFCLLPKLTFGASNFHLSGKKQIRYKYELATLSNLYIVYSQGGNIYEENINSDSRSIVQDSWRNPSGKIFAIKLRLRF